MAPGSTGPDPNEEGRRLVERLGGRWSAQGGMCRCPAHDDRTPSLSVRPGRARLLFHCFAGCEPEGVLRALKDGGLLDPQRGGSGPILLPVARGRRTAAAALRIWEESCPLPGTPAAAYLQARGLDVPTPGLRFHARTPCGSGTARRFAPAMIAAVRDGRGITGIHRTFLLREGPSISAKAGARRGLGPFGSGAVRLAPAGTLLGLAEGIETALSAMLLFGVPCWAALGTARFARIHLPEGVRELLLFTDNDPAGRNAEAAARAAFAGRLPVKAHHPPLPGEDWNDVLRRRRA